MFRRPSVEPMRADPTARTQWATVNDGDRRGERVMTMSARLVATSGLCIGLMAVPAMAADRERPTITAQAGLASTTASADAAPNCLLPGQIRSFGSMTTLTPRRPVTLDAADCTARGGELIRSTAAAVE
jgi:hypothetical protein